MAQYLGKTTQFMYEGDVPTFKDVAATLLRARQEDEVDDLSIIHMVAEAGRYRLIITTSTPAQEDDNDND